MLYYYSTTLNNKIVLIAAPFGYGPRVAASNLCESLGVDIHPWRICRKLSSHVGRSKLLINFGVMNADWGKRNNIFTVWIDCITWMRTNIDRDLLKYNMHLAEEYFTIANEVSSLFPKLIRIDPLYYSRDLSNSMGNSKANGPIMVSFGGVETPFSTDLHRLAVPSWFLRSLLKAIKKTEDSRKLICCMPAKFSRELSQVPEFAMIQFISPNRSRYLRLLSEASLHIVQPGLYGPFEAFELMTPTVFVPPSSYTQVVQARQYEKLGIFGEVALWPSIDAEIGVLEGNVDLEENVIFDRLSLLLRRIPFQQSFQNILDDWSLRAICGGLSDSGLVLKRKLYAMQCRGHSNNYLDDLRTVIY